MPRKRNPQDANGCKHPNRQVLSIGPWMSLGRRERVERCVDCHFDVRVIETSQFTTNGRFKPFRPPSLYVHD